jgi:hypothetical protein
MQPSEAQLSAVLSDVSAPDLTIVVRALEDEDRLGAVVTRLATHARALGRVAEILVADEGSGDNTVAVAVMMKTRFPEVEALHARRGKGWLDACLKARGRVVLLYDARSDAPVAPLAQAVEAIDGGVDLVAVRGRFLVFRRLALLAAFDRLSIATRELAPLEGRLLGRARSLKLAVSELHASPRRSRWAVLREALTLPLTVRL